MSLMEIPNEVIFDLIFPHLDWNDLLRLRLVCKKTKPLAEDYLRLHKTSEEFIEIDLDDPKRNLAAFLGLGFLPPVSRFSIRNVKVKTWEEKRIQDFANAYGSRITHLDLDSLRIPLSQKAVTFFESLPNLQELEIWDVKEMGFMVKGRKGTKTRAANLEKLVESIPTTFRHLRVLSVETYKCAPFMQSAELFWKFVEECFPSLEYIRHPMLDVKDKRVDYNRLERRRFGYVRKMLMEAPNPPNLWLYDMEECYWKEWADARDFFQLVRTCAEYNVTLLNVDSTLTDEVILLEPEDVDNADTMQMISDVVGSLIGLQESCFLMELPFLKRIQIGYGHENATGTSEHCSMPKDEFYRHAWANLEDLEIWIDSEFLYDPDNRTHISVKRTSELLDFFFVGIQREKMKKLSIWLDLYNDRLPYPRMIDVSTSCPNLKELALKEWTGNNEDLSKIWGNLQHLEKVAFEKCRDLGSSAFVGEDKKKPAFLNAKKLHSLTLDGLDEMLEITDSLFTRVIRHMPLKQLRLSSTGRLKKEQITMSGISCLLEGVFSDTIEKLKLSIELEGVASEEMVAFQKKFRSSRMI